jgi:hypothetical protein
VLENVGIQQLGTRAFLVGILADYGNGPDLRAGATFWFPVDDVLMLTVYPDLQAARVAYAARERLAAENGPKQPRWPWRR